MKNGASDLVAASPSLSLYVCSMGAAAAVTIFDGIVNEKSAALMKTGSWFSRVFAGSNQAVTWFVLALVFFCLFSALVTFAYKPKEAKEAFILGAGVLAMLNALVKPPQLVVASAASGAVATVGFDFVSSAFAQGTVTSSDAAKATLWIGIHGVDDHRNPATDIFVYDVATGAPVVNLKARLGVRVELPVGKYNIEITRPGYRGVVFPATVEAKNNLYQPRLEAVRYDGLSNLFGPKTIELQNNHEMARGLDEAAAACTGSDARAARATLVRLKDNEREKFTSDPQLVSVLCWR